MYNKFLVLKDYIMISPNTMYFLMWVFFFSLGFTGSSSNLQHVTNFDFTSTNTLSEDSVVVVGKGISNLFSFLIVFHVLHSQAKYLNKEESLVQVVNRTSFLKSY